MSEVYAREIYIQRNRNLRSENEAAREKERA